METLCKGATLVAHLTNFSFEFFITLFQKMPVYFFLPWCKKSKMTKNSNQGGPALTAFNEQKKWERERRREREKGRERDRTSCGISKGERLFLMAQRTADRRTWLWPQQGCLQGRCIAPLWLGNRQLALYVQLWSPFWHNSCPSVSNRWLHIDRAQWGAWHPLGLTPWCLFRGDCWAFTCSSHRWAVWTSQCFHWQLGAARHRCKRILWGSVLNEHFLTYGFLAHSPVLTKAPSTPSTAAKSKRSAENMVNEYVS